MTEQKLALVTGGNRGIGFQVVKELAEKGFEVFLTARDEQAGLKAVDLLQGKNLDVSFLQMDITSLDSIKAAYNELLEFVDHLDVLVNNAGVFIDKNKSVLELDEITFQQSLKTNTLGPLLVSQTFLPLLKKSDSARIINVSSGMGALSEMKDLAPSYSISKTALNGVTCQLASALKISKIAVNSACPGWVRTEMGGSNASRSVEEGADTIIWLATEASQSLSGKFLRDRKEIDW